MSEVRRCSDDEGRGARGCVGTGDAGGEQLEHAGRGRRRKKSAPADVKSRSSIVFFTTLMRSTYKYVQLPRRSSCGRRIGGRGHLAGSIYDADPSERASSLPSTRRRAHLSRVEERRE